MQFLECQEMNEKRVMILFIIQVKVSSAIKIRLEPSITHYIYMMSELRESV